MKVTDHIHQLNIPFKIEMPTGISIDRSVNIFILTGKHIILIDTGVAGSENQIFKYIEMIGRSPKDIKYVLLTHTHPEHMGALKTIKNQTGCKVAVHKSEKNWLEDVELQFKERPVPGFYNLVSGSCKADIVLNDSDLHDYDDELRIKVFHCPGHSPGSVSFLLQQDNALISGDAIPVKNAIPIYDDWKTSLETLEKLENMPYPEALLSAWDKNHTGEDVDISISNGFEVLYEVHKAFVEVNRTNKNAEIEVISKIVLEKMGLPSMNINPMFMRALKSHYKYV
jgi:hydroxyacylglutathione hydrolase